MDMDPFGHGATLRRAGTRRAERQPHRPHGLVASALAGVLICAGCSGGTTRTAGTALDNLGTAVRSAAGGTDEAVDVADDLKRHVDTLESIGTDEFSESDLARRTRMLEDAREALRQADIALVREAEHAADLFATEEVVGYADELARDVVVRTTYGHTTNQDFIAKLEQRTAEVVREAACDAVLDALAPEEAQESDIGRLRKDWVDPSLEVAERLAGQDGFRIARLADWVATAQYVSEVTAAAEQVAANYDEYDLQNPRLIELAARPPVRHGFVLYLRTCFSPPRSVPR